MQEADKTEESESSEDGVSAGAAEVLLLREAIGEAADVLEAFLSVARAEGFLDDKEDIETERARIIHYRRLAARGGEAE